MDFYIKQESKGRYTVCNIQTHQPVTVEMPAEEAAEFLGKMTRIKAASLKPEEPRLFYNRWED